MSIPELAITVVLFGNAFFFLGFIPWVGNRSLDAWLRASDASWRAAPERRLRDLEQSLRGYSVIRPVLLVLLGLLALGVTAAAAVIVVLWTMRPELRTPELARLATLGVSYLALMVMVGWRLLHVMEQQAARLRILWKEHSSAQSARQAAQSTRQGPSSTGSR